MVYTAKFSCEDFQLDHSVVLLAVFLVSSMPPFLTKKRTLLIQLSLFVLRKSKLIWYPMKDRAKLVNHNKNLTIAINQNPFGLIDAQHLNGPESFNATRMVFTNVSGCIKAYCLPFTPNMFFNFFQIPV